MRSREVIVRAVAATTARTGLKLHAGLHPTFRWASTRKAAGTGLDVT
ncbi:hypothetical protein [Streptomyces sp. NPDC096323]